MTIRIEVKNSRYTGIYRKLMINAGNFLFRYRNTVFFMVGLILLFSTKPKLIFESAFLDSCMDGVGFAVAITGQVLRALVIGRDYIKRGGKDKKIMANRLVQGGLFTHSRNPLYFGNILIIMGMGIIYNSTLGYILAYSFFIFGYLAIVMAEENFLKSKFGTEYEEYCKRVPRFIPRLAGIRNTLDSGKFNWARFLRKEYNMICIWVSSAIFLEIWEEIQHFGYTTSKKGIFALSLCLIPVFMFYCVIRYLKKHKKLST
ncbi:MAG: methyltransferase family protein [Candidatus Scalinduaceae bacterium]